MITFPYPIDFLAGQFKLSTLNKQLLRFDEESGSADGRFWSAELAPPLWEVTAELRACRPEHATMVDAKLRALRGGQGTLLWTDPLYKLDFDPMDTATISYISADRSLINISGLPPYYTLRGGDNLSVNYLVTKYWYTEIADMCTAGNNGIATGVPVYPFVPFGVNVGDRVELRQPTMLMKLAKDGHVPYSRGVGNICSGASVTLVQKR